MSYLGMFAPWIVFGAVPDWRWAAMLALLTTVGVIARRTRSGDGPDALILEISAVMFFGAVTAYALSAPDSSLKDWTGPASQGWLALTSWVTLAIRQPFTLGIARRSTPRRFWNEPGFLRVNFVITSVWATGLTLSAIGMAVVVIADMGTVARLAVQLVGISVPVFLTVRIQARTKAKAQALMAAAG
ncbi:hypothetical protein [Streptomyces sp. NBC_00996]|uniref:hypothetical protein n=1 Tax=Streptomyces sp. NBC_00996 TaxID=2903710 RepID=UPI00386EFA06|nr:hypothetical protein OG390_40945 [Streptomyces sp. NBC_00996]